MKDVTIGAALLFWLMGVLVAKGFWSTIGAMYFAWYAWYLCLESVFKLIKAGGLCPL
jgi:hypothetical protein